MSEYDAFSRPSLQDEYDAISVRDRRKPKSKVVVPEMNVDPAAEMNVLEKAGVGFVGGLHNLYRGGKDLIGLGDEENREAAREWNRHKEALGTAGTVGEIGAEILATAPIGGVVGGAGKLLTKAVPAAEKAARYSGRVLNPGLMTRGAVEGAASSFLAIPDEDSTRLGNATTAGVLGAAVPAVFGVGGKALGRAGDYLVPSRGGAEHRAGRTLEKALSKEELGAAEAAIRNAPPSRLPQTTAAMTDNPRIGELEAGARSRNLARFDLHDAEVARKTWNDVLTDTSVNIPPEQMAKRAEKIRQAGLNVMDTHRVDDGARNVLKNELTGLLDSNEVMLDPAKRREFTKMLGALEMPNLSVRGLRQVYDNLEKLEGQAVRQARESIKYVGDAMSDNAFSVLDEKIAKRTTEALEAQGAMNIRRTFQSPEGLPLTSDTFRVGDKTIPKVTGGPLRKAIAKEESVLGSTRKEDLFALAEDLRRHELYKPAADVGGSNIDMGSMKGPLTRAVSVSPLWKLRPPVEAVLGAADRNAQKVFDEALQDPQKFLKILEAKQARGAPLSATEERLKDYLILGMTRSGAVSQGE